MILFLKLEKYGFIEAVKESTNVFNKIILETLNGIKQLLTEFRESKKY